MSTAGVGVAMATFNGERFIRPQLESILGQDRMPDEVVIVDDASTDATPRILGDYARRYPGIVRLVHNRDNRGAQFTFARALAQCGARYIALADQDDEWLPHKLSVLMAAVARHPEAGMWFHDLAIINPRGETRADSFWAMAPAEEPLPVTGSRARDRISRYSNPVPGCTMLVDGDLRPQFLPFPERPVGHDWWLSAVCFFVGSPFALDERLGRYRLHPHQVAGIGTRLSRRPDEKLRLSVRERVLREVKRLWHRRQTARQDAQWRETARLDKDAELLALLDRILGNGCPAGRIDEYRRLRAEIACRLEGRI